VAPHFHSRLLFTLVPRGLIAMDLAVTKSRLRAEALARRDALEIDARLEWDQMIAAHVLALDLWTGVPADTVVAGYWPMRSEVDPRPILEELAARGFATCLPAVTPEGIAFRQWTPYEPLVPGGFGTLVPSADKAVLVPAILIVPLAAFDLRGFRIGYGKGHYDTALARLGLVTTIGVAYAAQEVAAVPAEAHDVRLDMIVTPDRVIAARAN
jgi:5-formyltetrahydrofolate cyclo-ligase